MNASPKQLADIRWLLTILYGLLVIWTGLLRTIEAQQFKPNAFWFCLVTGSAAIAAGYLLRADRRWFGTTLGIVAAGVVVSFYLYCFVTEPEKDANYRIAVAIIASLGELCVLTVPRGRHRADDS
jgi:peptidoglycan/LPS O-acetylase OafA/YrhL